MLRNSSGPTSPRGATGKFGVSLLPNMNASSATLPFRSEHRILSEEVRQFESNPPSDRSCAADVLSSSCLPGSDYKLEVKDNIDPDCVCYINKDSAKRTFQANIQVMTLSNAPVTDEDVRFILKPTLAYREHNTTDLGISFAVEGVLRILTPMDDLTLSAKKQEVCLEYQFTAISASCGNWPFAIHIHVDVIRDSKTITLGPYCTAAISVRTKELGPFPKPKVLLPLLGEDIAANPTVLSTYKLEVSDYGDRTNEIDKNNNVVFYNKLKDACWSTSVNLVNLVPGSGDNRCLDTLVLHCHLVYGDYPGEKVEFGDILQIKVDGQKNWGDSSQIPMAPHNTLKLTFRFDFASCNCHNRPFAIVIGGTYVLDGQNYSVAPARTPSTLVKTAKTAIGKREREKSAIASLGAGASEPASASLPAGAARRLKSRKAKKVRMSDPHCSIFSPPAMPPRSPSLMIEPAMDSSVNEASRSRFLNEYELSDEDWMELADILRDDDKEFLV
jgi:hypothetical protein